MTNKLLPRNILRVVPTAFSRTYGDAHTLHNRVYNVTFYVVLCSGDGRHGWHRQGVRSAGQ